MLRRLYRQRRRFLVFSLLVTAALGFQVATGTLPTETDLPADSWITWIALALTALIVAAGAILLVTYLVPALRHGLETMGLALILLPGVLHAAQAAGFEPEKVQWLWLIGTFIAVEHLIYGRLLDRFSFPLPLLTRRFRTRAAPEAAWAALAPLPGNSGRHFYPGTRFEPVEGGAIRATYPLKGGQTYQVETIHLDRVAAPQLCTGRFAPAEASAGSGGLGGEFALEITPREDGGADVSITEARDPAPLRRVLQLWMDDELGDRADCMAARIDGRRDWSMFRRQFPSPVRPGAPALA